MSLISEKKDFKIISDLIPRGSSVIDVGCSDGSLLQYLKDKNNISGRGMEIDQDKVQQCLSKGISVIEGDADTDLFDYPDNLFDFSILTYALQATKSPKTVLTQLVRISKKSIISFPNFGHWSIPLSLLINLESYHFLICPADQSSYYQMIVSYLIHKVCKKIKE